MLETLDEVDWQNLGHAYGEASDVPGLIRALASEDQAEREQEAYELFGNIWHQGTVYEASAYAVPFLIELLGEPRVQQKDIILGLLEALGTGNSYLDVHGSSDWYRHQRTTPEFAARLGEELQWVRAAHAAVVQGTPAYIELLSHPDTQVRAAVPVTLAACVERCAEVTEALRQRLEVEPDAAVRASLLRGLDEVVRRSSACSETSPPPEQLALYAERMRELQESPLVRFLAAVLWMRATGRSAYDEGLHIVRETTDEAYALLQTQSWLIVPVEFGDVASALADDPERQRVWLLENLDRTAYRARALWSIETLCRHRRSHAAALAPRLVERLSSADADERKELARVLGCVGEAAIEPLRALQATASGPVQETARDVLDTIRQRRAQYELAHCLNIPERPLSLRKAVKLLGQEKPDRHELQLAIAGLGRMGAKAREAGPLLRPLLDHKDQWLRAYAAWALWRIEREPELVLPMLLEDLRCRRAGLIVLDCLADMGPRASVAVLKLRQMLDSDVRLVEIGAMSEWAHEDDTFRAACRRTLAAIEGDWSPHGE